MTTISPCSVNLTALPTRFNTIWRMRNGSPSSRRRLVRRRADDEFDSLGLGGAGEQRGAFLQEPRQVERQRLELHLAGLNLRQIEQVVDDLQQNLRRGADGLGEPRLGRGQRGAAQQLGHADDAVHRRAQFMAHASQEVALRLRGLRELPVALDQFARAQGHLGFEPLLRAHDALNFRAMGSDALDDEQDERPAHSRRTPTASATAPDSGERSNAMAGRSRPNRRWRRALRANDRRHPGW